MYSQINTLVAGNDGIHDIEMTDAFTGYAYTYGTGKIIKTTDGGKSWFLLARLDSIYFEQMQFLDAKTGWICGEKGKVYRTSNSGVSWQDKSIQSVSAGNLLLYAMYFSSAEKGMVAGAVMNKGRLQSCIFYTKDAGTVWTHDSTIMDMLFQIKKQRNALWATGNNVIMCLADGRWDIVYRDTSLQAGQIRDITWLNDKEAVAISFNGMLIRTNDGGKTWNVYKITNNRLRSIIYINQVLVTAGDSNKEPDNLFISKDNGNTWTRPYTPGHDIHRIAISGSNLILVGKQGMIELLPQHLLNLRSMEQKNKEINKAIH